MVPVDIGSERYRYTAAKRQLRPCFMVPMNFPKHLLFRDTCEWRLSDEPTVRRGGCGWQIRPTMRRSPSGSRRPNLAVPMQCRERRPTPTPAILRGSLDTIRVLYAVEQHIDRAPAEKRHHARTAARGKALGFSGWARDVLARASARLPLVFLRGFGFCTSKSLFLYIK